MPCGDGDLDGAGFLNSGFRFVVSVCVESGLFSFSTSFPALALALPPMTPSFPARFGLGSDCDAGLSCFGDSVGGSSGGGDGAGGVCSRFCPFFFPPITPSPPPRGFFCCISLGFGGDGGGGDGDGRLSSFSSEPESVS